MLIVIIIDGYRDVKSKSYIQSYLPTIGSFTYAPINFDSPAAFNASIFSRLSAGLFGATKFFLRRYVNIAPSRYFDEYTKSSYVTWPAWQIPLHRSINCNFLSNSTTNSTSTKLYSMNFSISSLNNWSRLPLYSTLPLPNSIWATVSNR